MICNISWIGCIGLRRLVGKGITVVIGKDTLCRTVLHTYIGVIICIELGKVPRRTYLTIARISTSTASLAAT